MGFSTSFDVWIVATETVYKGVPFGVVTDWAGQGRIGASDKLRTSGTNEAWTLVGEHPIVADYLFVTTPAASPMVTRPEHLPTATGAPGPSDHTAPQDFEPIEMDVGWKKHVEDEEIDPDMIPLIDISLVLLIFFMMTATVSQVSPISVPELKNVADLNAAPDSILIRIDKLPNGELEYGFGIGDAPPEPANSGLQTLNGLMGVFDAKLNELLSRDPNRKPEVIFAVNKEIKTGIVYDLVKELDKRKKDGKIAMFGAQVNERQK